MANENEIKKEEPKKRGFLSKMFLVDEEPNKVTSVTNSAKTEAQQPQVVPTQPYVNNSMVPGVVNQDIYNNFKEILSQRNLPGPDYLELKTAADAMKSYLPDENQRFLFSFTSIKATNSKFNKKIVTDSIDEYIKYIEKERTVFQYEAKEAFTTEVTDRQTKIDELTKEIENTKNEINKLSEKIVKLTQDINTISGEKLTKQTELEIKNKNFDVTIETIINELKSDKLKIETIINE